LGDVPPDSPRRIRHFEHQYRGKRQWRIALQPGDCETCPLNVPCSHVTQSPETKGKVRTIAISEK
jgi:hypothetical protein